MSDDYLIDHPYEDPGDGRTECDTCGKWVFLAIHSCKGVPVSEAALKRMRERLGDSDADDAREMISNLLDKHGCGHPCGPCELGVTSAPCSCNLGDPRIAASDLADALRKVLELHIDNGDGWCTECYFGWPCATVRGITEALGGDP